MVVILIIVFTLRMFVAHSDLTHLKINNMLAKSEKRNMNLFHVET